jgi:acid phosphatase class B
MNEFSYVTDVILNGYLDIVVRQSGRKKLSPNSKDCRREKSTWNEIQNKTQMWKKTADRQLIMLQGS